MTMQGRSQPLSEGVDYGPTHTLTTFIEDVAPNVRQRVAEQRAASPEIDLDRLERRSHDRTT